MTEPTWSVYIDSSWRGLIPSPLVDLAKEGPQVMNEIWLFTFDLNDMNQPTNTPNLTFSSS